MTVIVTRKAVNFAYAYFPADYFRGLGTNGDGGEQTRTLTGRDGTGVAVRVTCHKK